MLASGKHRKFPKTVEKKDDNNTEYGDAQQWQEVAFFSKAAGKALHTPSIGTFITENLNLGCSRAEEHACQGESTGSGWGCSCALCRQTA